MCITYVRQEHVVSTHHLWKVENSGPEGRDGFHDSLNYSTIIEKLLHRSTLLELSMTSRSLN